MLFGDSPKARTLLQNYLLVIFGLDPNKIVAFAFVLDLM